ncbi:acetyltransferase, ribosomal protein N-acetylase [Mycolicibacterium chubuense NBB4]|uniref:Acetyltransferase, ribosomal protein N-acetylase n=1 Tax=Mycolicibacterium chubuense (strain NBB4) TaxID=710421 RepID=I4BG83_MYCCN|nr:GNAT family N-acetyltransferase [Mycolicibacterium chubuense]AFM16290.1 acetyltransferase, ribosomal protein N-acetylase [Mycolicibacterium chubuense NBB4]
MTGTPGAGDGTVRTLLDGAVVTLRALTPSDYDDVVRLASELTPRERYLRFLTAYPTYIGEWALSLTAPETQPETARVDDMVALGVFESGELVGVGNYAVLPRPGFAEIAVAVAHDQHDRGIGTTLLRELGHRAKASGIHHLVADVHAGNHAMREVIREAGWPVAQHRDGEVLRLRLDLDGVEDVKDA